MNEHSFERRAQQWIDVGPTRLPDDAIGLVMDAIADVPQQRDLVARLPRRIRASRASLIATAAVIVIAVGGAFAVVLGPMLPDIAGPRPADHLLFAFPEVHTTLERSGGPAEADERVQLGTVGGGLFVIAASCEGSDHMTVAVYDPSIEYGTPADGAPLEPEPTRSMDIVCDGEGHDMKVDSRVAPASVDLVVDVTLGTTWRVAVGKYPDETAKEPTFTSPVITDGWYALMEAPTMLALGHPGPGIGIQVPEGASEIAVIVQCSGDPITITNDIGGDAVPLDCGDPSTQQRVTFPADGLGFTVRSGSDGVAWVRMTAEADGDITASRPSAPPMPPELASVRFAAGDGQYLAFGSLGTDTQTVVHAPGAPFAVAGGDLVGVAIQEDDGSGMRLEAWSVDDGTSIRTLAHTGGRIFQSWVDITHARIYYGITMDDLSAEWRRVGLDGSNDVLVVKMDSAVLPTSIASTLAIDDSLFMVEWCPTLGSCVRHVHDTTTGATREIELDGERTCDLIGVIDGQAIAATATACDGPHPRSITVQDVDGGERRVLPVPNGSAVIAMTSSGPVVLTAEDLTDHTVYRVVNVDGTDAREVARIDHPDWISPQPAALRLPTGWVLLAGPLGDTPQNRGVGRAIPRLLNVETGEQIELSNLPGSGE